LPWILFETVGNKISLFPTDTSYYISFQTMQEICVSFH